ncbi:hypothetical protein ACFL59_09590 [Planctomycetota bacterium]
MLAQGWSEHQIMENYPPVTPEDTALVSPMPRPCCEQRRSTASEWDRPCGSARMRTSLWLRSTRFVHAATTCCGG